MTNQDLSVIFHSAAVLMSENPHSCCGCCIAITWVSMENEGFSYRESELANKLLEDVFREDAEEQRHRYADTDNAYWLTPRNTAKNHGDSYYHQRQNVLALMSAMAASGRFAKEIRKHNELA